MSRKNVAKENRELESICQKYVMHNSHTYDIVKQGSMEEYNKYLKESICGIISSAQNKYKDQIGADYDNYIQDLSDMVIKDTVSLDKRITIFEHAAQGILIAGLL